MLKRDTPAVFSTIAGRYPGKAAAVVLGLLASNGAEAVSVLTLMPMLVMLSGQEGATNDTYRMVQGLFESLGMTLNLPTVLIVMVVSVWLKAAFVLWTMRQVSFTAGRVVEDLRIALIRGMLDARWSHFISQPVGKLSNTVGNEVSRALSAVVAAGNLAANGLGALLHLALAFFVSWQVALAALVLGGVLLLMLRPTVAGMRKVSTKQTSLERDLATRFADGLQGIKPLKAMDQVSNLVAALEREAEGLYDNYKRRSTHKWLLAVSTEPVVITCMAAGVFVLVTVIDLPLASLAVLAVLFVRTVENLAAVQKHLQAFVSSESALLSLDESIREAQAEVERHTGTLRPPEGTAITVRGVSFSYGERRILDGIDMVIAPGQMTALIGPSGAGKSTIADLVLGLQRPDAGAVFMGDTPLDQIDIRAWRRRIGYVPQELFLFHDTIARNVTLGDPTATPADVEEALRKAGAWDFVAALDHCMDTEIGERGLKLSGGQRQRIAIARALVRKPSLLILDEATTALDPATEEAIFATLRSLAGQVTILAISHQQTLMKAADRVYRLEAGRLIEV